MYSATSLKRLTEGKYVFCVSLMSSVRYIVAAIGDDVRAIMKGGTDTVSLKANTTKVEYIL